jgi:hypothetical protein
MGRKRFIFTLHKHHWHLSHKKEKRLNIIYRRIEEGDLKHGRQGSDKRVA